MGTSPKLIDCAFDELEEDLLPNNPWLGDYPCFGKRFTGGELFWAGYIFGLLLNRAGGESFLGLENNELFKVPNEFEPWRGFVEEIGLGVGLRVGLRLGGLLKLRIGGVLLFPNNEGGDETLFYLFYELSPFF